MTDAPSPERVKRKALTRSQLAELVLAQMGKCAKCGERLNFAKKGQVVDEHLTPLAEGGTNETSNRALYCVGCARPKTAIEQRNRGKSKRIAEGRTQHDRRKERGPVMRSPAVSRLSKHHPGYVKKEWRK